METIPAELAGTNWLETGKQIERLGAALDSAYGNDFKNFTYRLPLALLPAASLCVTFYYAASGLMGVEPVIGEALPGALVSAFAAVMSVFPLWMSYGPDYVDYNCWTEENRQIMFPRRRFHKALEQVRGQADQMPGEDGRSYLHEIADRLEMAYYTIQLQQRFEDVANGRFLAKSRFDKAFAQFNHAAIRLNLSEEELVDWSNKARTKKSSDRWESRLVDGTRELGQKLQRAHRDKEEAVLFAGGPAAGRFAP